MKQTSKVAMLQLTFLLVIVRHRYENHRRTYLDQQSERKGFDEEQAKHRKYRSWEG